MIYRYIRHCLYRFYNNIFSFQILPYKNVRDIKYMLLFLKNNLNTIYLIYTGYWYLPILSVRIFSHIHTIYCVNVS